MSTPARQAAVAFAALKKRAFSLGAANAFDYAMQFLLPIVLVRFLSPQAFGEYRLFWLVLTTVLVVVPLHMPNSLYFILPRSDAAAKRLHVHQTVLYMAVGGLLGGLVVGPWNPLLGDGMRQLAEFGVLVPAAAALFAAAYLLDMLPTVEERVSLQARLIIALAVLRTGILGWAAWATGDLRVLIWLLLALLAFKMALLLAYVARVHGLAGPWFERGAFRKQFTHVAPLGIAAALYGLRAQADQWVAASLFALGSFAAFSIASVLGPMVNLFRHSVNFVFLPSMSRLHAAGDVSGMVSLNNRANVMVATLVYPLLAFAFFFAEELISLVYTDKYAAAAPAMRVYIAGLVVFVVEISSLMLLLREGMFALRMNVAVLCFSVALSWLGATHFGLAGAALGSTLSLYADRYFSLRRIGPAIGVPLRRMQDWPALGRLLLWSTLAGALAWVVAGAWLPAADPKARLAVGATIVAAGYAMLWLFAGADRKWPLTVRSPRIDP